MDSSKRAGRYAEEDEDDREAERVSDQEEDEYGDEIVDLGDDVEPFSMEFNPYSSSLAQTNKKGNKLDFGLSKIIGPQETSLDPFGTLVRRRALLTIIELCGSRSASVEALRQRSRPLESGCDNLPATQSSVAVRRRRRPRDRQIDHI